MHDFDAAWEIFTHYSALDVEYKNKFVKLPVGKEAVSALQG